MRRRLEKFEELRLRVHAEFLKDGRQVVPNRALADEEGIGDCGHALTFQEETEDLPLSGRQLSELWVVRHRRQAFEGFEHSCCTDLGADPAQVHLK